MLSLQSRKLSPARLARLLFPPPRPGRPDRHAARRRALARQLAALNRPQPAPSDLELDAAVALRLDHALDLPAGYCALVATLDRLLLARARARTFRRDHHARPPAAHPLSVGYALIVPRPDGSSVGFVDGRLPAD